MKVGDVVVPRLSGQTMTVIAAEEDRVLCRWLAGARFEEGWWPKGGLRLEPTTERDYGEWPPTLTDKQPAGDVLEEE